MTTLMIIGSVIVALTAVLVFALVLNPTLRSKFMGVQIKATRRMLDDNSDELRVIGETIGSIGVETTHRTVTSHEDELREINAAKMRAKVDAAADVLDSRRGAINDISGTIGSTIGAALGATKAADTTDSVYCKYCGAAIDGDSLFCKKCGQKQ